jgi:hypothetical protein
MKAVNEIVLNFVKRLATPCAIRRRVVVDYDLKIIGLGRR